MSETSAPTEISFEDFAKLDLRVATIKDCEHIEGADKLYKLTLDVGALGERIICAGIKEHYLASTLVGKQIIIVANLAPRKMRGIMSHGMLLAASNEKELRCVIPENMWNNQDEGDMAAGSQVK